MSDHKHVAVKCTYNNGEEGAFVGFNGTCSENIIRINTQTHMWCSQPECSCKQYCENGFRGERPVDPCLESTLFRDWWFGAGTYLTGKRKGSPKKAQLIKGGIALLTTRFPGDVEKDRKIIGLYEIKRVTNLENEETKFYAEKNLKIRLPLEEVMQLFFWDYYSINSTEISWGHGLLRYLNDSQIKKVLLDLQQTVQSNNHKEIIAELLEKYKEVKAIEKGQRDIGIPRIERITGKRKYGPGGEGEKHKILKEWIATHPQDIGLETIKHYKKEYVFLSGDTVDILFEIDDENDAVVEIETNYPFPGCYQAIKYRALRCAQRSLDLDSDKVKAIIVAWEISDEIKRFCDKYKIIYYEIKK